MIKNLDIYKTYYSEVNGYNSNCIENSNLKFKDYMSYYNSKTNPKKQKEFKESYKLGDAIARQEVFNFKVAVNKLFEQNLSPYSLATLQTFNKTLLDGLENPDFKDRFHALHDNGIENIGKVRTTVLWKGYIDFMDPEYINEDLHIINSRMKNVLESKTLTLEEKVNEIFLYHLNFELIHPFVEGNGRTGRLMMDLQLFSLGLPSANFEQKKGDKKGYLEIVSQLLGVHRFDYKEDLLYKLPAPFMEYGWLRMRDSKEAIDKDKELSKVDFYNLQNLKIEEQIKHSFDDREEIDDECAKAQKSKMTDEDLMNL